jgi:ABC-type spermidine/putrescine transport system permease subunit II
MLSYTLSRKEYVLRKPITIIFVLTMYFNAGLIPNYFLIKGLGLVNNFLVYVFPTMIAAFNMIVIRTYIRSIPESMVESARIDGAGDFRIFIRVLTMPDYLLMKTKTGYGQPEIMSKNANRKKFTTIRGNMKSELLPTMKNRGT